ncbi:DUF4180 domain-containing protein [Chryseobacterium sp.]|uniref:DUF4180 domain-containing protein n=1 Tax=Chryseobacterium sp. TaxID=1871047 RepID=UPI00261B7C34|nr:DUF4180 domain-containing protein [Chryseobacterium sp.]
MIIKSHTINDIKIAEVISDEMLIQSPEDGLDFMGNIYYQGYDKVILYEKNLNPEFFDLKTKIAGEILQKFSNYRIGLVIIGNFSKYESKSIKEFIFESNKMKHVNFVETLEKALVNFSN